MYDFNSADEQRSGELIPDKTIVRLMMQIRPGGAGPEGWLTNSKDTDAQYLSCEFTVMNGPFAHRKLWENIVLSGGKLNDKGQSIAGEISRAKLRAILESARNINPTDMGEQACAKRRVQSFGEFDQMEFAARIGIEKGKDGYADKNKISLVITPDKKEYQPTMMGQAPNGGYQPNQQAMRGTQANPGQSSATPSWAAGPPPQNNQAANQQKSTVPTWAQ